MSPEQRVKVLELLDAESMPGRAYDFVSGMAEFDELFPEEELTVRQTNYLNDLHEKYGET